MKIESKQVKVSVSVAVKCPNGYVLLKRLSSYGEGSWSFPVGYLKFGESIVECAVRETQEELGVTLDSCKIIETFTEDYFPNNQYITLYCIGETSQNPTIMEPANSAELLFINDRNLPTPLFCGVEKIFNNYINL